MALGLLTAGTAALAATKTGTSGNGKIDGTNQADTIPGGDGNDRVFGDDGNDRVFGDRGNDRLYGGRGHDHIYGGPGNDTIYARDDTGDTIDCGSGRDVAIVDPHDVVHNCETVRRSRDKRD